MLRVNGPDQTSNAETYTYTSSVGAAPSAPAGYRTLQIDGPTPDELVNEVAPLMELMNDAPRGDLREEDYRERPDQMIQWEQALDAAGHTLPVAHRQRHLPLRVRRRAMVVDAARAA